MDVLGFAHLGSLFVSLEHERADFDRMYQLLGIDPNDYESKPFSMNLGVLQNSEVFRREAPRLTEDDWRSMILAIATAQHETVHIRQLSTATILLQLQLAHLNQLSKLSELLHATASNVEILETPLLDPYVQNLVASNAPDDTSELGCFLMDTLGADLVMRLICGDLPVSVGDAIDAVNQHYAMGSVPITFYTEMAQDAPASPCSLSLGHLLEGETRIQDLMMTALWSLGGAPEAVVDSLERGFAVPGYYEAQEYFYSELGGVKTTFGMYSLVLHLALWSDIAYSGEPRRICWEDYQPCWRFVRLVAALKSGGVPASEKDYHHFSDELCARAGITSARAAAQRMLQLTSQKFETTSIEGDLLDRHQEYARQVSQDGFVPINGTMNTRLINRCLPWFRFNKDRVVFQSIPEGISAIDAYQVAVKLLILEGVLRTGEISFARKFHGRARTELIRQQVISPTKSTEEDFQEASLAATGLLPHKMFTG